jgi:hypothetical protein
MRPLLPFLLVLAAPAAAQDAPAPPPVPAAPARPGQPPATVIVEPAAMMIAAFDADGDARVTRAEFDAGLRRSFEAIARGATSLGYIGFADWSERWMGDRNTLPSPFETDRDGDNRITLAELSARFDLLFARFDGDKDGVLARSELVTVRPQMPNPAMSRGARERRRRN